MHGDTSGHPTPRRLARRTVWSDGIEVWVEQPGSEQVTRSGSPPASHVSDCWLPTELAGSKRRSARRPPSA